ncbi:hypothetical protein B296_00016387 [Ensete ventricosum]|uniref:Uncharacterized protein n=1 Tax=Ensete ventricosum TaxID=4639 RepID=A0A427A3V1_ENSVE|nr:hypothetical protein B296_00016387 [Ensete ventricosum]
MRVARASLAATWSATRRLWVPSIMGSEKKRKALALWFLSTWYVSQQAVITPAMSRSLEGGTADEKNYYAPDPHGGSKRLFHTLYESMEAMTCMLHQTLVDLRGADSHGTPCTTPPSTHNTPLPPSHGGGGGGHGNPPPTPAITTPPVPLAPPAPAITTPLSPPVPLAPPAPAYQVTPTPPATPMVPDPNTPPFSCEYASIPYPSRFSTHFALVLLPSRCLILLCSYWRSHPTAIWALIGYWCPLSQIFGMPAASFFGSNPTAVEAMSDARSDGIGALYREGTASFLNSLVDRDFFFTTQQVRDAVNAAVVSHEAAAAQAELFKKANKGHLKHH